MIHFTQYANNKFLMLQEHSFSVSKEEVIDAIEHSDALDTTKLPLYIAEKNKDKYMLKVVYKKKNETLHIITFYPFQKKKS